MTTQKLIVVAVLCSALFTGCKKKDSDEDETTPPVPETALSQIATQLNLLDQAAVKYNERQDSANNSLHSLFKMAQWLEQQPEVEKTYITDEYIVDIDFKNGLKSSVSVIPVDPNGQHLIRGSGSVNQTANGKKSKSIALQNWGSVNKITGGSETIGNNKVLIFIPYYQEFYNSNYTLLPKFSQGSVQLIPTLKTNKDADLTGIDFFSDYGFIIIDSHGSTDGFEILTKIDELDVPVVPGGAAYTKESLEQLLLQANNIPVDKIMNGLLEIKISILEDVNGATPLRAYKIKVTDKYIRQIQPLDDAVVLGNFCYSGFTASGTTTSNMAEAFKSIGAVSYYGYGYGDGTSNQVGNGFAKQMEDSLITNLVINDDSTGTAHLINNITMQQEPNKVKRTGGIKVPIEGSSFSAIQYTADYPEILLPFYFKHYFDPRYGYGCGTFTDPRDQQEYDLACIGNQTWFAENLNWAGAGVCYDNLALNCDTFGRLYSIAELTGGDTSTANPSGIKGICPNGWHVPSKAEWQELMDVVGGNSFDLANGLLSTSGWSAQHNNSYGFNGLPAGEYVYDGTTIFFINKGQNTYFWSCSPILPSNQHAIFATTGQFYHNSLSLQLPIEWKASCRCVKD